MQSTPTQLSNIKDYLEVCYRRKWLFILTFLPISGIVFLVSFTIPPVYKSTTSILVERQKVPEAYVQSTVVSNMQEKLRTLNTQIMSRTRLEKIIGDYDLYHYEEKKPGFVNVIQAKLGIEKKPPAKEEIVNRMRRDVGIIVKGRDSFQVSYIGPDPEVTMRVTNALASMFIEENLKVREQRVEGTSEFLTSELEKARQELEKQESAVKAFKEKYMGALPEQLNANLRTLDRLQLELQTRNDAIRSVMDRKLLLEKQLGGFGLGSNPLEQELVKLRQTFSNLSAAYTEKYPDVIVTKNRIKEIEGLLASRNNPSEEKKDEELRVSINDPEEQRLRSEFQLVNSEIETLKGREVRVKNQIKEFERRVEETFANEQRLKDLTRNYGIMQRNYQSLLQKRLNARLSENMEKRQKGEQFRILDPANLPEKPYGMPRLKVRLFGLVAGGGIGVGLVLLVESLNSAFRKPEDFVGVTDIPVFATIPRFSLKSMKK